MNKALQRKIKTRLRRARREAMASVAAVDEALGLLGAKREPGAKRVVSLNRLYAETPTGHTVTRRWLMDAFDLTDAQARGLMRELRVWAQEGRGFWTTGPHRPIIRE